MGLKLKPLEDRVVVEPKEAEDRTASGIILPDTAQEKPQEATVIAIGPGKASDSGTIVKMTVKVGDNVLYGKYSGSEVNVNGKDYLIMRESDILAIL